jgi:hypothetical protein
MNTLKEFLLNLWNHLSPTAHTALIFFALGLAAAWLIRLL